ncbi:MAG: Uma2 family endonuclease [Aureliella sp.]
MNKLAISETRTILRGVSWEVYNRLSEERTGSTPRISYDRGLMEMMTPSRLHEQLATLVDLMIRAYTDSAGIEIGSAASTTFNRTDLTRGFEADKSYYIAHETLIRSKDQIDLAIDPPPDLVLEIEITSPAIAKMQLFAAMGIPEVWRYDGSNLLIYCLGEGSYDERTHSLCLPNIPLPLIEAMLDRRHEMGENAFVREFRRLLES